MPVSSLELSRRDFMKVTGAGAAVAAGVLKYTENNNFIQKAEASAFHEGEEEARLIKSICTCCPGWDVENQMPNTGSGICDSAKFSEYRPPERLKEGMETVLEEINKEM
ncbi:MAG: twin-arginine translocation signal domain-containing protein [Archaeoglobaceae archaeon]